MTERLFVLPEPSRCGSSGELSYSVLGRIAQLRAEIRLLELGHKVAAPGLDDDGVDLVVDYRFPVQVKSCALREVEARWEFEFRTARKDGRRAASNQERLLNRAHVAFVLLYARDANVWWVIPGEAVRRGRVRIAPGGLTDRRWREAWHLLRLKGLDEQVFTLEGGHGHEHGE